MAINDQLRHDWEPMLRWSREVAAAQETVLAETQVWVAADRIFAHMRIETGGTGDPTLDSKGTNSDAGTGCHRSGDCSPDLKAHGLLQIFWPPFRGVDWKKIEDPAYNLYIGAKILAYRYKECGSWTGASRAFFSGSCTLIGTCDNSTGTCDNDYEIALGHYMTELNQLGIGATVSGSPLPKAQRRENRRQERRERRERRRQIRFSG